MNSDPTLVSEYSAPVRFENGAKRAFDIVAASAMLILFAPLIATLAYWVKKHSGGSVFFGHTRVGQSNKPFKCLKFQTMVPDAEDRLERLLATDHDLRAQWDRHRKLHADPRVIPGVGEFLRNSSLDELPQLWNILIGDMSFVGPRPVTEEELVFYGPYRHHYAAVRPGLTGPWQIGGRSNTSYAERVRMDVNYVQTASITTDALIVIKTAAFFLTGRLTGGR